MSLHWNKKHRRAYKYENDNSLACKDLTSGESGTKIYELAFSIRNQPL